MKDQIILFSTAKLAKEIGFKEKTHHYYFFYEAKEYKKLYPKKVGTAELESNSKCLVKYGPGRRCETIEYEEAWVNLDDLLKDVNEYPARDVMFQAPTQSLLQKWLREEFDIIVVVTPSSTLEYDHYGQDDSSFKASKTNELTTYGDGSHLYEHYIYRDGEFIENGEDFSTYEESLEEGLQCALKLIKESKP